MNYVGRLAAGTRQIFDRSHGSTPDIIELGLGSPLLCEAFQLILCLKKGAALPGLELALRSMEKGEEAVVKISPDYAFGSMGCPPRIPGGAQLEFIVRLVSIDWPCEVRCHIPATFHLPLQRH